MRALTPLVLFALTTAAGCVSTDAPVESANADTAARDAAAAATQGVPVDFAGTTGAVAYVCTPAGCPGGGVADGGAFVCAQGQCIGAVAPVDTGMSGFEPDYTDILDGVDLTLEWAAATPASETLTLGIGYEKGDTTEYITVSGSSPLEIHETGLGIPQGAGVVIYAWTPCTGAIAVFLCETVPQDFTIKGTLTTLTAPDEAAT